MEIAEQIKTEAAALQQRWDSDARWAGIERPYSAEEVVRLRGRIRETHVLRRTGGRQALEPDDHRGLRAGARLPHRQPGRRVREGGPSRDLPLGLAGRRRREPVRPDLPRPVAVPGQLRAGGGPADQQRAAPRRPDRVVRRPRGRLPRADRRRRRGRLRRTAQRVRADELDDQGRRGRRALRGPAELGEEVRPPRRQGVDPDGALPADADRSTPGRRRARRADDRRRPHRRARRDAAHERHRRARQAVHHRRTHRGRLLPRARGQRRRDRTGDQLRALRRHAVVRDLDPRHGAGARRSRRQSTRSSRASCSPTTARRPSTGRRRSTTRRSRSSRRSSARWATGSSSSRSPGSTR